MEVVTAYLVVIIVGLVLGSFATALGYRTPSGISWGWKRSACPRCSAVLQPKDLIPIFSWLSLKGRCRYCREKIPALYPFMELGVAAAAIGVYAVYGFSSDVFFILALLPFLAALLVIDLKYMVLPNQLILIAGLLGFFRLVAGAFFFQAIDPSLVGVNYILAVFIYAGLAWGLKSMMSAFLKKDALGYGDIKFFAVAGLWLGLSDLAWFCILSGISGVALAILWQVFKKERVFPFGPALIASLYILLLLQGSLLR